MNEIDEAGATQGAGVLEGLSQRFPDARFEVSIGQDVVFVPRELLREFVAAAKDAGFDMCVDVTAVDYLDRTPRFDVVVGLVSTGRRQRLRVRSAVPGDDPEVPSVVPVHPGADFFEREVFDLMGIRFRDHPDLTRILMPDDWEGHPLRKDYPVGSVPVRFKSANKAP